MTVTFTHIYSHTNIHTHTYTDGLTGGSVVKNLPANAGDVRDTGLIPGLGRSPGRGNGNPEYFLGKVPWTEEPDGYSLWSHK